MFDISKIQIQKQITTLASSSSSINKVCLIFQRYKFKSKSQLAVRFCSFTLGVFDISKIQIQKQITTQDNPDKYTRLVCLIFQRYKFKSKSQLKRNSTHLIAGVFDISKIQIQKQITTTVKFNQNTFTVCLIFQRYKFKSKSQQRIQLIGDQIGVFDISKIQIQKQITTWKILPSAPLRCV